ncbi:hypothetical protein BDV98DRAFT_570161 [Pterulicium gracile]|uniref:Uncharacterized protein n=1 Tax=Pterulicium gracile TaxID=1884261 RepID=A0A5C3QIB2_9AGAR|nr:hypothetical protein BDV98DRAFT_570161 [Pterula gracilis]
MSNLAHGPISPTWDAPIFNFHRRDTETSADSHYLDLYGGWEGFMLHYHLDPADMHDVREARSILARLKEAQAEEERRNKDDSHADVPQYISEGPDYDEAFASNGTCQSFGGYENFMASFGLKPWEHGDVDEGLAIMAMMEDDGEDLDDEDDEEHDEEQDEDEERDGQRPSFLQTRSFHVSDVTDSFGGYEEFMHSYGLKPYDPADRAEGEAITKVLEEQDRKVRVMTSSGSVE